MKKHKTSESIVLVFALLCISGASLAYNLLSSEGGDIAVSLTDIIDYGENKASAISEQASANLMYREAVAVSADVVSGYDSSELLPPVVVRP